MHLLIDNLCTYTHIFNLIDYALFNIEISINIG